MALSTNISVYIRNSVHCCSMLLTLLCVGFTCRNNNLWQCVQKYTQVPMLNVNVMNLLSLEPSSKKFLDYTCSVGYQAQISGRTVGL